MVQKNETIAIIVSLLVVVILITVLCFCCTQRYLGISSRLSSYSTDDPEKSSTSSTERSPTGPGPASETGSFDVEDKPGGGKRSPSPKSPGSNGSFDVQRASNDRVPYIPGPSANERGILRNGGRAGSRGPGRVAFQPGSGGSIVVGNQGGGYTVSDGGFDVVGNGTRLSMTGQTVQPRQRGGHGNDTNTDVPEIASESGSSGGFDAR
ncbi:hypothetical protein GRF29_161g1226174 [Pseudopithomyces chartarum]|uniref:Uncharacterized protein n=1 Tax=Pseudopithomyces chartarum TaxID=1892770 RepID=A0AAN6LST9_9PLEO|nr:hypothetical protein GRF29_161g1226174 [Pseudopithomyces chartarum]